MGVNGYLTIGIIGLCIALTCGCASRRAMRPTLGKAGDPPASILKGDAWYIQSTPPPGEKPVSCSFVEFDQRGDYLDFQQHRHAYLKIHELATNGDRLIVIIFVHGWKNSSQSGNVVEFNNFLRQVASSPLVKDGGYRVHGVYVAWRGNAFPPSVDAEASAFQETTKAFGGEPIVNVKHSRNGLFNWLFFLPEQASYWNRKGVAEDKASRVCVARTIFTCAQTAKRYGKENRVFLMGHSFGALMLEQALLPATLAQLTGEWPLDDEERMSQATEDPLPLDLILLVNSAAPSIYAKQYYEYMAAHREALARNRVPGVDAPIVISVTSTADWATGVAHPLANFFAPLYPTLWRWYNGNDFILAPGSPPTRIPQWYYYRRTPGHNPLLVNNWVVTNSSAAAAVAPGLTAFQQNLDFRRTDEAEGRFFHTTRPDGGRNFWKFTTEPADPKWSTYHGCKPYFLRPHAQPSGYWIMQCPKEIISGHDDIWNQQAMDMYAALFREEEYLRRRPLAAAGSPKPAGNEPQLGEPKTAK
jgi:hypothetical protein